MPFKPLESLPDFQNIQIESDRILLKPVCRKDAENIFKNFTPEITKFMAPASPKDITETEEFIESALAGLERGDDLHFVISNREDGEFLGVCGLHEHGQPACPEVGIWLKKSAHGNKYGLEAIIALKEWVERTINTDQLIYPVDRRNSPSRNIPETLGAKILEERKIQSMSGFELDEIVYGIVCESGKGS